MRRLFKKTIDLFIIFTACIGIFLVSGCDFAFDNSVKTEEGEIESTIFSESVKTYTVSFNTDGGGEIESQQVEEGCKAVKPQNPQKPSTKTEEYVFLGWYLGNTPFDFETPIVEDIILTAKYKVSQYSDEYPPSGL